MGPRSSAARAIQPCEACLGSSPTSAAPTACASRKLAKRRRKPFLFARYFYHPSMIDGIQHDPRIISGDRKHPPGGKEPARGAHPSRSTDPDDHLLETDDEPAWRGWISLACRHRAAEDRRFLRALGTLDKRSFAK